MKELEAKYLLSPGQNPAEAFRRTLEELVWAGFTVRPQGTRPIEDVYYDTPDRRLQRAGWSLRRRSNRGIHTFTTKQLQSGQDSMFERRELEQTSVQADPDPDGMGSGPVEALLRRFVPEEVALLPIYSLSNQRLVYALSHAEYPRSRIELVMDRVQVHGSSDLEFVEFEAELKQGPVQMLEDVAQVLIAQPGLVRSRVSKYQRGLQATGCPPADLFQPSGVPLTPSHSWHDLGVRHLNRQFRTLIAFEPLAYESVHPEGVHQMRVATRRLRAAMKAFEEQLPAESTPAMAEEVRWLTRVLGGVRDLDVQLEQAHRYHDWLPKADRTALSSYQHHLQSDHRLAHQHLIDVLDGDRYRDFTRSFGAYLELAAESPGDEGLSIESVAQARMPKTLKAIRKQGRRISKDSEDDELHRLRIRIKRLRYQLEFLAEPYGQPLNRATRHLRRLQDTLGEHQDACIARAKISDYRERHAHGRYEKATFNRLIELEDGRARQARARFRKRWKKFDKEAGRLSELF